MKKTFRYVVQKEGQYFVSRCLNVQVSSFGDSEEEAVSQLKEALELYFEDSNNVDRYIELDDATLGTTVIDV